MKGVVTKSVTQYKCTWCLDVWFCYTGKPHLVLYVLDYLYLVAYLSFSYFNRGLIFLLLELRDDATMREYFIFNVFIGLYVNLYYLVQLNPTY